MRDRALRSSLVDCFSDRASWRVGFNNYFYCFVAEELDFNEIKRPVLELHVNDRKIHGNDSCNSIFGSIETLDGSSISFGKIGSTMMACPNMTIANAYVKTLQQVKSYKLEGLNLTLYNIQGEEVLKFLKVD